MKYKYCKSCHNPIRATSTFYESVINGNMPKKKLIASCGASGDNDYCMDCWLILKSELKQIVCNDGWCQRSIDGICSYLFKEVLKPNE